MGIGAPVLVEKKMRNGRNCICQRRDGAGDGGMGIVRTGQTGSGNSLEREHDTVQLDGTGGERALTSVRAGKLQSRTKHHTFF